MIKTIRNCQRSFSGLPVLEDSQIEAYLRNGDVPTGCAYLEVPPGNVIVQRGFWLRPKTRMHHTAQVFLVSTDPYLMHEDAHPEHRSPIYCYRCPRGDIAYLGSVEKIGPERTIFGPLLVDLHPPIDIAASGLAYVGRVIAAI
ncbi:hypothetical protein N5C54_15125 [Pseudomonas chengduensis]|uniref:hypothetical protein n=1 Tax=Pseudomonas sp. o96-267 TaxID=2479853 RepID=UPI00211404D0|nr:MULTISPECIES: hypothetical protein [Pseudomonas]MDH0959114.1 hypothetical protein [Pseudomonas chengduensis]MDV5863578.1 hypothetical protein [Pseudomonas mendocina]